MSEIDLDQILAKRAEATGSFDTFAFTFKGERFTAVHPMLASEDWKTQLEDIEDPSDDTVGPHYMGDQWARFAELGGSMGLVVLALQAETKRMTETDRRSGRPTRPSNSSGPIPQRRPKRT